MKTRAARRRKKAKMAKYRNVATQTVSGEAIVQLERIDQEVFNSSFTSISDSSLSLPDPYPRRRRRQQQQQQRRRRPAETKTDDNREPKQCKKQNTIKPGPLCYKKKQLRKLNVDEGMAIPTALDVASDGEHGGFERAKSQERTELPLLEEINIDLPQMEQTNRNTEIIEIDSTQQNQRRVSCDTPENAENLDDERNESNEEHARFEEERRYIRITAQTVHIHNHFYKS